MRQDIFSSPDPDNEYNESSGQGVALTIHSHNNKNVPYLKYWLTLVMNTLLSEGHHNRVKFRFIDISLFWQNSFTTPKTQFMGSIEKVDAKTAKVLTGKVSPVISNS